VKPRRFSVALSFPGEKRDFVSEVASSLSVTLGRERVLYDEYLTHELARPNLDLYLGNLYREESELLVPFYCADFERKKWCQLEWRQMRDVLFQVEEERIMPFRFDDTPITGLLSIDGYATIGTRNPQDVANLILQRLGHTQSKPNLSEPTRRKPTDKRAFYIFAMPTEIWGDPFGTVFYKLHGEDLVMSLCRLFMKEYTGTDGCPSFQDRAAAEFYVDDQVLLDESIEWLGNYEDPDPGIYDPRPPTNTLVRAQYAMRARKWEELLRARATERENNLNANNETQETSSPAELLMSAEEQRNSALNLLILLAQAYYKILESTISMATLAGVLDMELNESYFWLVTSITNLLKNHQDLKDFPVKFEPLFPDLYPSTIRDVDWVEMVAPDAEQFLSTVQRYVYSKGLYGPEKGSDAWVFIELFRPSINLAIERAIAYKKRVAEYSQQVLGSLSKSSV
jgi:hypothetical protein